LPRAARSATAGLVPPRRGERHPPACGILAPPALLRLGRFIPAEAGNQETRPTGGFFIAQRGTALPGSIYVAIRFRGGFTAKRRYEDEKPYRGSCVDVDCFAGPCAGEALRGTQVRDRSEDQGKRRTSLHAGHRSERTGEGRRRQGRRNLRRQHPEDCLQAWRCRRSARYEIAGKV